jgi:hypothetical protein
MFALLDSNFLITKVLSASSDKSHDERRGLSFEMPPTAKSTGTSTKTKSTTTTAAKRSNTSQVREGTTKARNGAVDIIRQSAERAVDVPVGAALTVRDRVNDAVEPWTESEARERELKSLRTQVTRELNRFERRGGQARRKATQRARSTRTRVEREVKQRRREVERTYKQNRTRLERTVKENRVRAEQQLKKAQTALGERVPALS